MCLGAAPCPFLPQLTDCTHPRLCVSTTALVLTLCRPTTCQDWTLSSTSAYLRARSHVGLTGPALSLPLGFPFLFTWSVTLVFLQHLDTRANFVMQMNSAHYKSRGGRRSQSQQGRGCAESATGFPAAPFTATKEGGCRPLLWVLGPCILESLTVRAGTGFRDGSAPIIG